MGDGIMLAIVLEGANRYDMKLMGARLEAQVMVSSDAKEGEWFHLYLDRGYDNKTIREIVEAWGVRINCKMSGYRLAIDRHDLNSPNSFLRNFAPRQDLY